MCAAIHAIQLKQLKISEAAKVYSVLWQTLGDRISGKGSHGTKPGPQPKEEESEFAEFLVDTAKAGYRKSRKQVKVIAKKN